MKVLQPDEQHVIRVLKRLEKRWPPGLWLFAANGILTLMRNDENYEPVFFPRGGGADPDYIVDTFRGILCDGGDW